MVRLSNHGPRLTLHCSPPSSPPNCRMMTTSTSPHPGYGPAGCSSLVHWCRTSNRTPPSPPPTPPPWPISWRVCRRHSACEPCTLPRPRTAVPAHGALGPSPVCPHQRRPCTTPTRADAAPHTTTGAMPTAWPPLALAHPRPRLRLRPRPQRELCVGTTVHRGREPWAVWLGVRWAAHARRVTQPPQHAQQHRAT